MTWKLEEVQQAVLYDVVMYFLLLSQEKSHGSAVSVRDIIVLHLLSNVPNARK